MMTKIVLWQWVTHKGLGQIHNDWGDGLSLGIGETGLSFGEEEKIGFTLYDEDHGLCASTLYKCTPHCIFAIMRIGKRHA